MTIVGMQTCLQILWQARGVLMQMYIGSACSWKVPAAPDEMLRALSPASSHLSGCTLCVVSHSLGALRRCVCVILLRVYTCRSVGA